MPDIRQVWIAQMCQQQTRSHDIGHYGHVGNGLYPLIYHKNSEPQCQQPCSIRLTIGYGRFRGKARYQRGHSALYHGFKLAPSTLVLSTLDVYLYGHIPQAQRFYHYLCLTYNHLFNLLYTDQLFCNRCNSCKTQINGTVSVHYITIYKFMLLVYM